MQSVTVKKEALLEVLKTNKEKHVKEFNEALVAYKVKVKTRLSDLLIEIEENVNANITVNLPKPVSYEKDYTAAIRMLEFSVDETLEIPEHDFRTYVLDEWNWKATFTATNSFYHNSGHGV